MNVRGHDRLHRRRIKRDVTCNSVVKRAAQAVHIGKKSLLLTLNFFRRNIIRRAVRLGERFRFKINAAREPKINQLRFVIFVEKNIPWLDVAMQEVMLQRGIQRGTHLIADIQHIEFRHAPLFFNA